jgi:serine/threonine protein kinase/tetratricopeptide (TPR) repeat protein
MDSGVENINGQVDELFDTTARSVPLWAVSYLVARRAHGSSAGPHDRLGLVQSIDPAIDERFELQRLLGEGATGAVYLAVDRETGEQVALKRLFRLDQNSVARFKREFRSLADIHHPSLVKLYDLHRGRDAWFITMEYVAGKDFRQYFGAGAANDNSADREILKVFHALAGGVRAIHRAGMLHRDLKPSNALIADGGRVVVLDFGLVRDIEEETRVTQSGVITGTPAYMPPEQALGEKLSEASDWYAFGVMLYEAISGMLPIEERNAIALLQRKLTVEPEPLRSGAPNQVLQLCMRLLARDPQQRPTGAEVLETLAAASGEALDPNTTQQELLTIEPPAQAAILPTLFGRAADIQQLRAANMREDSLVVHIRGTSGSGKSSLVEHFLNEVAASHPAPFVLRSRCNEREAMPFKALDGVMDALASGLSQLDDITCAHILPRNVEDLVRVFPVLERLRVVQTLLAAPRPRDLDNTQVRRRAEQALRDLMTRTAEHRRVVLWIDDVQWGDLDSAAVLRSWLEQPLAAPILILLSYRSEEIQTSTSLGVLLREEETVSQAQVTIDLQTLHDSDVRTLCLHRLSQRAPAMVERIVEEARGNPFLAQQLTAIAEAKLARNDLSLDGLSMEALVQSTSAFLGEPARALLHVLAIAGRPIQPRLALSVAEVSAGRAHVHTLRSLRLVRSRDVAGESLLEVYHDRVREAVQISMSAEDSQRICASLLRLLEMQGHSEHDWLHTLALGAGQRTAAFRHGLLAAARASETLAFERAAELYAKCLTLSNDDTLTYELWMKLAAAQAYCRRGHEAARAYLNAAENAPVEKRTELLKLAASHLVRCGRFEEGEQIIQRVLRLRKLYVPNSQSGLLAAIGWELARIALRKLDVSGRTDAYAREMTNLALLYGTLSIETQLYAPLRSTLFQARSLRLALDYSDPEFLGRALCMYAAVMSLSATPRAARRSKALQTRAEELFRRVGSSKALRLELLCTRALSSQFLGQLEQALEPSNAVAQLMQIQSSGDGVHGDYYYLYLIQMVRISALQSMGRLLEARPVLREHVATARATDNVAAILQITMNRAVDEQALDMCAGSRARLDAEYLLLPKTDINLLIIAHQLAVMRTACATRDFDWAFERLRNFWKPYLRSFLHRGVFLAILAHGNHARLLLNHYVETGGQGGVKELVGDDIAHLQSFPSGLLRDTALMRLQARVAYLSGERDNAIQILRRSMERPDTSLLRQELAQDQYALGRMTGGVDGAKLVVKARQTLSECGIHEPDANMRAYVPELLRDSVA